MNAHDRSTRTKLFSFPTLSASLLLTVVLGIATPVAVERILKGTGRFNVGLASVMTVQGIGASLSNGVAGWLTTEGGFALSHLVGGGVAAIAILLFIFYRRDIVPDNEPQEA